ncbi:MAG: flagellar assembly protein FliW [Lachnospiraceae bacterium]|nr:flagellar assembly protein FliW [Lachnospiraceae bacterium]
MEVNTRLFGSVIIEDDRIITFPKGIVGFPNMTKFALMYDSEKSDGKSLQFLVSLDEPEFSLPVLDPKIVSPDYDPVVEDELIMPLGGFEEGALVLVTVAVPHDLTKMTVNLMAPIIIDIKTRNAAQIILNDDSYQIKFPIYDILAQAKEEAGKAGE